MFVVCIKLFCCYGVTANANMSPVAFGIVFGNENGESWSEFREFVKKLHPTMDIGDVTIITDQDKGQMNAIEEWMPEAGHFIAPIIVEAISSKTVVAVEGRSSIRRCGCTTS